MPSEEFNRYYQALAADYRASLQDKLRRIDTLRESLASDSGALAHRRDLLRELHSIAGAASTFGLPAVGDAAAAAEDFLGTLCEAGVSLSAEQYSGLDALIASLKRAAEAP